MPLCTFQRKLRGCSGSPPAGAGGICPVERGRMEVRPLPGSPSCYDCLWVTCLLGCLSLCFNKCCFNARIYDLVNDNVSVHSNSSFSCLWPHPRWQPIPAPGSVSLHGPLLVHFGSLVPAQSFSVHSGLEHNSSFPILPDPTSYNPHSQNPPQIHCSHPLPPGSNQFPAHAYASYTKSRLPPSPLFPSVPQPYVTPPPQC